MVRSALTGPQTGCCCRSQRRDVTLRLCIAKACRFLPQLHDVSVWPEPWAQDSVTFALSWWKQPVLPLHLADLANPAKVHVRLPLHDPAVPSCG